MNRDNILKDKKIVFVINTLKEGGAAKILTFVANNCVNYFDEVHIITLYSDEVANKIEDRIIIHCLNQEICSNNLKQKLFFRISLLKGIRNTVIKISPDLVCSFISDVCVYTWLALIGINIPFISAERGDPYTLNKIWKFLTYLVYNFSTQTIFQTELARDFYGKHILKNSKVITNPYLLSNLTPSYNGIRKKTIVTAGRFAKEKGHKNLIKAFYEISKIYSDYSLIIYGDGELREEYNKLILDLNIKDKVFFPGYVKNVQKEIYKDGIFVLPSLYEGIPNALIEAMMIGIPTVSSDCSPGGPRFLTNNGKRGMLVPPNDVNSLINAIKKLIDDEQYARNLSEESIKIKDILNPELIADKWMEVFVECI